MTEITRAAEVAAQATTPSAEQIAAAQAILASVVSQATLSPDITDSSVTTSNVAADNNADNLDTTIVEPVDNTSASPSSDAEVDTAIGVVDPVRKQELEEKFLELINNPRYWSNPNRVKRLAEALVLPMFDDRSMQQFSISAKEELLAKEMKSAIAERRTPVMPTDEEITVLAEEKYRNKKKQEQEQARKAAEKAANKAAALKS